MGDQTRDLSGPIRHAAPWRLAALAHLHGVKTAAPSQARVLHLGCGDGSHLLPLAVAYPTAYFVGVDPDPVAIEAARAAAGARGLDNLELEVGDPEQPDAALGRFDQVSVHGLLSRLPEAQRDVLLEGVRHLLAPQGVLFLGVDTHPGASPQSDSGCPPVQPFRFVDLVAHCAAHGLVYLANADGALPEEADLTRETLGALGDLDVGRVELEQRLDDLTRRSFRRVLFCRAEAQPQERPDYRAASGLFVSCWLNVWSTPGYDETPVDFFHENGSRVTLDQPAVKLLLCRTPRRRKLLTEILIARNPYRYPSEWSDLDELARILTVLLQQGLVELHVEEPSRHRRKRHKVGRSQPVASEEGAVDRASERPSSLESGVEVYTEEAIRGFERLALAIYVQAFVVAIILLLVLLFR